MTRKELQAPVPKAKTLKFHFKQSLEATCIAGIVLDCNSAQKKNKVAP